LQVALAPCLIGYGIIAARLHADPATKREGNRYWKWIENYVETDYVQAVATGRGELLTVCMSVKTLTVSAILALLEKHAVKQSVSRVEELAKIFLHATKVGCFALFDET